MSRKFYLSACLCFKEAAGYLPEWLAYYSCLGVDHFYLYNNESTDEFLPVISPYLSSGHATLINFPGKGQQQAIYDHCLVTYGSSTRWLMFCDDDEFMMPEADTSLPDALQAYEPFAGIGVCWMLYGSSGHMTQPDGLVIENYLRRSAAPDQHVKCIVDPSRVVRSKVVGHAFECKPGHSIVTEMGSPITTPLNPTPSATFLRINHYLAKSRDEMIKRRSRIAVNTGEVSSLSMDEWFKLESNWNQIEDRLALRYTARVRSRLSICQSTSQP